MQSEVKKHANAGRIYNVHTSKNFTIISNEVIRSEHLELDEKGFLFYLLSLPDDWVIYKSSLPKLMGEKEGRVDRIFKILQEKGYIVSQKITDEKNRFVGWTHSVSSVITEFSREGVFSVSGNPEVGKSTPIQRDISIQKKISPILDSPNQGPTQISQMAATQQIYGGPVKKKVKTEPRNALKESELAVQKGLIKWLLDPDFIESLQLWFDYKHERKEGYMDKGLAALFGKISKFTKQEVMTAIEESMSSNWAGLFPKSNSKSAPVVVEDGETKFKKFVYEKKLVNCTADELVWCYEHLKRTMSIYHARPKCEQMLKASSWKTEADIQD